MDAIPVVTAAEAESALAKLKARQVTSRFANLTAKPSQVPGLAYLGTLGGAKGYLSADGRYVLVGVVLDTYTDKFIDGALDGVPSSDKDAE